ncbi:MAG: hypothetical protein NDI61_04490 [Bdellovibrionaceae bacterium]|nr:hypothetical protein [Pseudobdellovibrionaceae bacterium]
MTEFLPEVYRYLCLDMRPRRLLISGIVASLISACILFIGWSSPSTYAPDLAVRWLLGIGFFVLSTYGTASTGDAILSERSAGTWDFQRLTPQHAVHLTLGKFIGASMFPLFLGFCFWFWALIGWLMIEGDLRGAGFFPVSGLFLLNSTVALALGILVSTHAPQRKNQSIGRISAGIGAGLFFLNIPHLSSAGSDSLVSEFFGLPMSLVTVQVIVTILIIGWTLAGSTWRIGVELLEPSRAWRIPVFLTMMMWVALETQAAVLSVIPIETRQSFLLPRSNLGLDIRILENTVRLACAFGYILALFGTNTLIDWRGAWRKSRWGAIPGWSVAWVVLVANLAALDFYVRVRLGVAIRPEQAGQALAFMILLPLFCLRDWILIQSIRLGKWTNPEAASVLLLFTLHTISSLLFAQSSLSPYRFIVAPIISDQARDMYSMPVIAGPVVAQIALAAGLLAWALRGSNASPSARSSSAAVS